MRSRESLVNMFESCGKSTDFRLRRLASRVSVSFTCLSDVQTDDGLKGRSHRGSDSPG